MLTVERRGRVQVLTLNRPEKRNSLHPQLLSALADALGKTRADRRIHVVVLTGAGSTFCAGLDLFELSEMQERRKVDYMRSAFSLFRQVYELRQPVIAAVNGPAMAGGFDLAAFCDLRLCSTNAKFAQTEILLGLTQIMYPVYKMIGLSRAKELALTGKAISADEAHTIGFVAAVHQPEELLPHALELAEELANRPAEALFETKRLGRVLIEQDNDSAINHMLDVIITRLTSDEHQAALTAYLSSLKRRRQE